MRVDFRLCLLLSTALRSMEESSHTSTNFLITDSTRLSALNIEEFPLVCRLPSSGAKHWAPNPIMIYEPVRVALGVHAT